jgi:predicted RNase H-like HicB family nuclease
MAAILYPAVLERGEGSTFAIWLPDWPDVVVADRSQADAIARAETALSIAAEGKVERGEPMPTPSDWNAFDVPADCDLVVRLAIKVTPPDKSERVNVYLPKSLIEQVDKVASEWGMSRSSLFGLAVKQMIYGEPTEMWKAIQTALSQRR